MSIHEKLARLTETYHRTAVCRRAGLHPTTLWRLLKSNQMPTVEVVLALSRTLGVDPGWLIDDHRNWPPVRTCPEYETPMHAAPQVA
jgi:transcriptional regulator with XRE-family HTH domain